jgi:hypothetical protein
MLVRMPPALCVALVGLAASPAAGGQEAGTFEPTVTDPAPGKIVPAGCAAVGRMTHGAALLSDGRVMLIGGATHDGTGSGEASASTEIWAPASRN